jgi:hypothetical protein
MEPLTEKPEMDTTWPGHDATRTNGSTATTEHFKIKSKVIIESVDSKNSTSGDDTSSDGVAVETNVLVAFEPGDKTSPYNWSQVSSR